MTSGLFPGECEPLKRHWHGGLLIFAAGAFVFNVCAWLVRREKHLAANAIVYGAVTVLEIAQVQHHAGSEQLDQSE